MRWRRDLIVSRSRRTCAFPCPFKNSSSTAARGFAASQISGSKNSSLPILAATLLTRETCIIRRVPDLCDTNYMVQILRALGAEVERASGTVRVCAEKIKTDTPYDLVRKMRASICVMGPLLAARQGGHRLPARRLRHRRPPDRSASEGLRGARREGPRGRRQHRHQRRDGCAGPR